MPEQVGVRELREHLSTYLDRARNGETIEVTDRGTPIAVLMPLPDERRALAELTASGVLRPAKKPWRARDWSPLPPTPGIAPASEILDEQRADRL
jgi:prevent-host-death family protein